jgi:glycosyltransferase involved in cell wall biosynthesis
MTTFPESEHMPSVSVIIPTYNGGKYILDAVNSVLRQTHAPLEIIVVDDGSREDILQVLSPVSRHITYIRQDNAGPAAARNRGIRAAKGEFIAFLDDDDLWHPTKLEAQMRRMHGAPDCGLVYSYPILIDENGSIIFNELPRTCPSGYVYYDFLRQNRINTSSTVLLRASVLDRVGFFDENLYVCEDYDLWLRISRDHKVIFCSEAVIFYRQSTTGVSKNNYNHLNGCLYVMNKTVEQLIKGSQHFDKKSIDAMNENLRNTFRTFAYKVYYGNGDRIGARHLLAAALRRGPRNFKDIVYLMLFSLPRTWFESARNVKRALWGTKQA